MKGVLAVCTLIVTVMFVSVGYNYHRYSESQYSDNQTVHLEPIIDMSENYLDTVQAGDLPEWCNDSQYVENVVIPMQEDHYKIKLTENPVVDSVTKFLICKDSHACGIHETLYDKWNDAREIKIQMIKINSKLDSLEKNY